MKNWRVSQAFPSGEGGPLAVDEEVTFLKIENPPKSPLEALQKPCYLLVGVLLIRLGYSPIHLPRWGRLTNSAIVLNVATNSPINQNLNSTKYPYATAAVWLSLAPARERLLRAGACLPLFDHRSIYYLLRVLPAHYWVRRLCAHAAIWSFSFL